MATPIIADHGPIYAETVPGRFPVEPWATLTNLIFLAVIIY
jgi:hemolysin III